MDKIRTKRPAAEALWCQRCRSYHQPRERAVPCSGCSRPTFAVHALCEACDA